MARRYEHGRKLNRASRPGSQRGFAGILMVMMLAALAVSTMLVTFHRSDALATDNERKTTDELAEVKAALLGYAVRRGGATGTARPGELPCPDTDGDGLENAPCPTAASLLGRIPWKTLGIPEPKDSSGETLWYTISSPFRDSVSNLAAGSADRINSDTRGTLTVRAADGATILTDNAVAVIIAPGAPIGTQNRSSTGAVACTLTGLTVARGLCANNYFETATGTNNAASTSGPFIAGGRSDSFNDRLAFITTSELIPLLEMRVGNELKALLQAYKANSPCNCYPWADNWAYSGGIADTGQNRGRFPSLPAPYRWGEAGTTIPALPAWIAANDWHNLFWYSVSRGQAQPPVSMCRTCSANPLTVFDSQTGVTTQVQALLFTPGTPLDGIARLLPPPGQSARTNTLSLYLQDAANNDGANIPACRDTGEIGETGGGGSSLPGQPSCDAYTRPTATAFDRDRLFTIP